MGRNRKRPFSAKTARPKCSVFCRTRNFGREVGQTQTVWPASVQTEYVQKAQRARRRTGEPRRRRRRRIRLRFSLHQRWFTKFAAKTCAGNVLLVEVTTAFFEKHTNAVFVLQASGFRVGKVGEVF
jgi:hypothetical protein